MTDRDPLGIWTIYDHPSDFPEYYVARLFEVGARGSVATDCILLTDELDEMRGILANRGLVRMNRDPKDDPVIVETWV